VFREQMHVPWSDRHQRRFDRMTTVLGAVVRRLPAPLQAFPYNIYMWDLRRRIRAGRPSSSTEAAHARLILMVNYQNRAI